MDIKITPLRLNGTVNAAASKSYAHRNLIAAFLSGGPVNVRINQLSEDIHSTISCLRAMGATVDVDGDTVTVGAGGLSKDPVLDCNESGTAARFLLGVGAYLFDNFKLTGKGSLLPRPFSPLCEELEKHGCRFDSYKLPMNVKGRLTPGDFYFSGDISSQFISGLMFVLPLLGADSRIVITSPLQSAAYVDMTADVLSYFYIKICKSEDGFFLRGNQKYKKVTKIETEGDWSNSAAFLCMNALGCEINISGLNENSVQGDRAIIDIVKKLKALDDIVIDASQIPDLVPVIASAASVGKRQTRIINAQRLRIKESDRLASTQAALSALGADIEITGDGLVINGKDRLTGGVCESHNDHRIVMAAAVMSCACEYPVIIRGAQAINKSYPSFFEDFKSIGGKADVVSDR